MVECYTDVDVGTLYYAIRQLAKDELITQVAQERVARGGMRTVYRITAAGKERFQELLYAQCAAPGPVAQTLYSALLFLHLADPKRLTPLLHGKIEELTAGLAEIARLRRQLTPMLSTGGLQLLKHLTLQRRLDRRWLQGLLEEVSTGRVRDVPDPRRLEADR